VASDIDLIELRKAGLGDHLERFAGRIRQQMEVELAHRAGAFSLWKTMLKALAEASGRFQEKDSSPLSGFDPQVDEE
jgi:hypothetical protein